MSPPLRASQRLRFGEFELDLTTRKLSGGGRIHVLAPQPLQVLELLTSRPGQLITREELIRRLWPTETFVDYEQGLKKAVNRLRDALNDSADNPRFIETLPRQGYRFIANVHHDDVVMENLVPHGQPVSGPLEEMSSARQKKAFVRYAIALLAVGAICLAIYLQLYRTKRHPSPIQAIAVLPLDNLTGDTSQDGLTEGLTDQIITDLAKVGDVRIISRASVMGYRGSHRLIPEIARELHVDALVEGSYERMGQKVRLRVQLIRCDTEQPVWAEIYDRDIGDLFQLESEVARDITLHVQQRTRRVPEQILSDVHTTDPQAFQDYLKGRHYWALRTREGLQKAVEYFEAAIRKDPKDARSYAALAHCYLVMPFMTEMLPGEGFAKARKEAEQALALDPSLSEAHLANAAVLMYNDWNFRDAEREFHRALEMNPNDATAHQWHGELLVLAGRNEEAIQEERIALELDPLSAIVHHEMGGILRDAGRPEDAVQLYKETLSIDPQFVAAYWELAVALRRQGKLPESIHALQQGAEGFVRVYRMSPEVIREIDELQSAYAHSGRPGYFRQALRVDSYLLRPSYYMARDYAQLGDKEAALAALRRSYQKHDPEALWMFTDPELEPLHSDERYRELVRAIGFAITAE